MNGKRTHIVELEAGVFIADGKGDPPRTLDRAKAKRFTWGSSADRALEKARKYRPFANAVIHQLDGPDAYRLGA